MPLILALDAATGPCSVAVLKGALTLAHRREERPQKQAALLLPMTAEALAEAGATYADLARIVCTVGPGSFTGIRIALAAARGLGFAGGVPVSGISTLAVTAWRAHMENPAAEALFCLLMAGKGELYAQEFAAAPGHFHARGDVTLLTPEAAQTAAQGMTPCGPGAGTPGPDALHAALLAHHHPHFLTPPEPFYFRPPDAKPQP